MKLLVLNWINEILLKLKFDEMVHSLYDNYIAPMPELLKFGLGLLVVVTLIVGLITIISKLFKIIVVIAIVGLIVYIIIHK